MTATPNAHTSCHPRKGVRARPDRCSSKQPRPRATHAGGRGLEADRHWSGSRPWSPVPLPLPRSAGVRAGVWNTGGWHSAPLSTVRGVPVMFITVATVQCSCARVLVPAGGCALAASSMTTFACISLARTILDPLCPPSSSGPLSPRKLQPWKRKRFGLLIEVGRSAPF